MLVGAYALTAPLSLRSSGSRRPIPWFPRHHACDEQSHFLAKATAALLAEANAATMSGLNQSTRPSSYRGARPRRMKHLLRLFSDDYQIANIGGINPGS